MSIVGLVFMLPSYLMDPAFIWADASLIKMGEREKNKRLLNLLLRNNTYHVDPHSTSLKQVPFVFNKVGIYEPLTWGEGSLPSHITKFIIKKGRE